MIKFALFLELFVFDVKLLSTENPYNISHRNIEMKEAWL